ncbi:hypothetical protein CKM354_000729500 [Cercospora kikuchii]|uniref:Uncharacterized protein n=1 Tax=Cercospora kikuchii TaxID=84275 RepID=A0A9P3FE59_9PEZI|nr:uncharacterized protein CKM354_000729500 [Cercospora kikuchii]GIZ44086.1 hypothetical protein CKM354_000729500 [Cercospora kikuchii]
MPGSSGSESTLVLVPSNSTILTLLITTSHDSVLVVRSPQDATDIRKAANLWLPSTIIGAPAGEVEIWQRAAGLVMAWTGLNYDQFTVSHEPVMRDSLPYPLPPLSSQMEDQKLLSTIFLRVGLQKPIYRIRELHPAAELLSDERNDDGIGFELYRLTKSEARSIRAQSIGAMIPVRKLFGMTSG